jgi:phospho-N-acetylmuramoyl-pentapeptide-transferase
MNFWLSDHLVLRAVAAFLSCALVGLRCGPAAIAWLSRRFREPIKSISPTVVRLHQHKAATPTMGGLFIVSGIVLGTLLFGNFHDQRVWTALLIVVGFSLLGAVDDLVKLRTHRRGISAWAKLCCQCVIATTVAVSCGIAEVSMAWWNIPLVVLVLVSAANAVNLTDGLDGLAAGCCLLAAAAASILLANTELTITAAAAAGSLTAFLWFNRHPARVFMGDTGSQALGALLGFFALSAPQGWLLVIIGGVFAAELMSVVLQMASYRIRGKRLFLCAPLHHHYQFLGWSEPKIVKRFWLVSVACAVSGIAIARYGESEQSPTITGNLSTPSRVYLTAEKPRTKAIVLRATALADSEQR